MTDSGDSVLDQLPLGIWVGSVPDAIATYANAAFREIVGIPAVASRLSDIPTTYRVFDRAGNPFPAEELPFSRALSTGANVVVEDMVLHRDDGRRVPLRAFASPLRDASGRITHVVVVFTDISRESEMEAARDSLEARLKLAVDHSPIALFSIDREGIITLSEGAGLAALGVRSGELVGKSVFELYRQHPTIPDYIRRGLGGDSFYYTVQVGDAVYDSWLAPIRDAAGAVTGVLGVSHDMSEPRRLQAAIIQSDRVRAMGTLAASVAHEINNPLTYVMSHLEYLAQALDQQLAALAAEPGLAAAAARAQALVMQAELAPAREGIQRIATITRDLGTFSRPQDTRLEPIDVRRVIEAVLKLSRKNVEARARLALSLAEVAPVVANEARLCQVVMNLLANAQHALDGGTPPHEIALTTGNEGDRVIIEVADTGPGVPVADRERVFEPFVTSKPLGQGTGLGLFVCRNIVRGLGGEISVRDRPGGGAIFRVELPAARRASVAATTPPAAPHPRKVSGRVLLIDDDPLVARALALQLEQQGFETEVVMDAAGAAAALLGESAFDLIYCDLMMKGTTGMDLHALVAARAPHRLAHMVFMTGGAFTAPAAVFLAEHRQVCVEKPFDILIETHRRLAGR
jgi:PAS domain S-box-containing protein